jgi:hypothetical protein
MPDQAMTDFAERVQRAVTSGDRLAERLASQGEPAVDVASLPEYQELVRLKVIIQRETSRALTETAQITAAIEQTDLAEKLDLLEADR